MNPVTARADRDKAAVVIGGVLALTGAVLVWQAFAISLLPSDQVMGPRLFPVVIGGGLVVLGLTTIAHGLRTAARVADAAAIHHWRGLLWVAAALPALMVMIGPGGFVPAEAALFALTARGFGSRRPVRDLGLGFLLAALVYVGFVYGLGLQLPLGDWHDYMFPED